MVHSGENLPMVHSGENRLIQSFQDGVAKIFVNQEISNGALLHLLHQSGTLTGILYGSRMDIHMCTKELTPCLGKFKFSCCNLIKVEVKLDKKTQQLTWCVFTKRHSGTNSIFQMCCFNEPN